MTAACSPPAGAEHQDVASREGVSAATADSPFAARRRARVGERATRGRRGKATCRNQPPPAAAPAYDQRRSLPPPGSKTLFIFLRPNARLLPSSPGREQDCGDGVGRDFFWQNDGCTRRISRKDGGRRGPLHDDWRPEGRKIHRRWRATWRGSSEHKNAEGLSQAHRMVGDSRGIRCRKLSRGRHWKQRPRVQGCGLPSLLLPRVHLPREAPRAARFRRGYPRAADAKA